MKKYFILALICMTTLGLAAQNRPGQQYPQGGNHPGQYDNHHNDPHHNDPHHNGHNADYQNGYRDGYRDGQRDEQRNGHHKPAPAPVLVANAEQLQFALQILDKQSYDDKRMEVAKLCVVLCPFPVKDLARMASRFTMEDRKVDFLIYAHRYCPDKENYHMLRDCLRYRSDYDKLMQTVQPGYRSSY